MKKILTLVAFAAANALVAGALSLPLSAADSNLNSNQRSVTTMGTVNVTIPADSAKLFVSLSVTESTLEQSNSHLDEVLAALQAELKMRGFPEKSVVLKNRDVRKSWDYSNGTSNRKFLGYLSSSQVIISIDDISKLSPLITYLGLHEEFGSWQPDLRSSKIGEERKAVLASALRAARNKAEILAKEGGAKLGALLEATEMDVSDGYGGFNRANISMRNSAVVFSNNAAGDNGDSDSATPAGDHVISINVRIRATFALE